MFDKTIVTRYITLFILPALVIAACTPATPAASTATLAVSETPTETPPPSATPLPSPTPVAWTTQPITAENAGQVGQVNQWGRGRVERTQLIQAGQGLVTLTPTGTYIYDMRTKKLVVFAEGALDFTVSSDEKLVATGHAGGDAKVWSVANGALVQSFSHPITRYAVPWKSEDPQKDLADWNVRDVGGLAFSPDSSQLAVGTIDGIVNIWQIAQQQPAVTFESDILNTIPSYIRFSPDGQVLLVVTGIKFFDKWRTHRLQIISERLSFWHISDQSLISYSKDPGFLAEPSFLPDGRTAVTLSGGNVRLWEIETGQQAGHFGTNVDEITALEYAADGTQITVTGAANGKTVRQVRKMPAGNLLEQEELAPTEKDTSLDEFLFAQGHYAGLTGASPSGQELRAWGMRAGGAYWLDIPSGQVQPVQLAETAGSNPYFYAPDQSIAWCKDGELTLQPKAGAAETIALPSQKRCTGAALSPGKTYAAVWGKKLLTLVTLASGQVQDFTGLQRDPNSIAFSSDETFMASGSLAPQWNTAEIVFWQTDPPASLQFPPRQEARDMREVVVSQDKSFAVSIGEKIRIWLTADGNNVRNMDSYSMSVALSPDDKLIATGDYYGDVHIWSVADGSELALLKGHQDQVIEIGFTPDGSGIYSISLDETLRLWGIQ